MSTASAIIEPMEAPRTKTIPADELRAGYEVVRKDGTTRIVERVHHLLDWHIVLIVWEGDRRPRRRSARPRDHEFEVVVSEIEDF